MTYGFITTGGCATGELSWWPHAMTVPNRTSAMRFTVSPTLDYHAITATTPERLGHVHLFRLRRRHDEVSRRGRARDVAVLVHAFPQQRRERFAALVAQDLMLVPGADPPPVAAARLLLVRFGGNRPGHRERRVHRLVARGIRIDERDVIAAVLADHRELHAHARARSFVPRAVRSMRDVLRIVDGLVAPRDDESIVRRLQLQARRCVRHADAVVEPPRAVLLDRQVLLVVRRDILYRDAELEVISRAALERVIARVGVAEPHARDEVRRRLLVRLEVRVEREQDEAVLLRVEPAAGLAMREQAGDDLRDQIEVLVLENQRLEHHAVDAAVTRQQQVVAVLVAGREVRGARGLADVIQGVLDEGLALVGGGLVTGEQAKQPAVGLHRDLVGPAPLAQQQLTIREVD